MAGRRSATRLVAFGLLFACAKEAPPPGAHAPPDPLAPLRAFEVARRGRADFLAAPPSDAALGADPYDLVALSDGTAAGVLRGRDALVALDRSLVERARVATPRGPSAVAVVPPRARGAQPGRLAPGDVLVASELESVVGHYRPLAGGFTRLADIPIDGVLAARDIAVGADGAVHLVEERSDRLISVVARSADVVERRELAVPRGPLRIVRTRDSVWVLCLVDHTIVALDVERDGFPRAVSARARLDGPFWGFDAIDVDGGTLVVAGGAEDHALDRRGGFFGYVDSFVYVYFRRLGSKELEPVAAINASELGVVTPKAVAFAAPVEGEPLTAVALGYGSARALRLTWREGAREAPEVTTFQSLPGASAAAARRADFVVADPLLDAWVVVRPDGTPRAVHVPDNAVRDPRTKLGEALFFTDLMAPANRSEGALSRFTCETCHFEGTVDGRTHHTGRGDVRATTKPLLGLFNNRPHFSRALDPDLSAVAENEFRVAGARSGTDPHFSVEVAKTPWLRELELGRDAFDPTELRVALMAFLMEWTPRTNPSSVGRRAFTDVEQRGALAFRERCERCHEARASADAPSSRVPFERWEALVLDEAAPLVWASSRYEKTGVEPYVHERGARVPSLRRLYKKRPYFTNGSAPDLEAVLRAARFEGPRFSHGGAREGERLDDETVRALLAFLALL